MKKIILSAALSIVMCLSLIAGATFALFTSETAINVAVTAGNVELVATVENISYTSTLNELVPESKAIAELRGICDILDASGLSDHVYFDFSLLGHIHLGKLHDT